MSKESDISNRGKTLLDPSRIKAVFLDRDGTLITDVGYLSKPEGIRLLPGVQDALLRLQKAGFPLFIITNQSGVARGFFSFADVHRVQKRLLAVLQASGITIRDWRACPHHPEGTLKEYRAVCSCRKPEPGMILELADTYDVDLPSSYVIGDRDSDIEAGLRAGCHSILVGAGRLLNSDEDRNSQAEFHCPSLGEAVDYILRST